MAFTTIPDALEDIKKGKMIIVADDEDRENEGDLVMAASLATPEAINFMAKEGRGIICCPITTEKARQFHLDMMVSSNSSQHETAFTVSVDAIKGGTGISAQDRCLTIHTIVDGQLGPDQLARPGHIFPLIARPGGVLRRAGHTEAAVDLAILAGLPPVGVICEIMNDDGSMARIHDLELFSQRFQLKMITIKDLIAYRAKNELLVTESTNIAFPNQFGNFQLHLFEAIINPQEHHLALVKGDLAQGPVLVRVHSECLTGDVFGSMRCDCGPQLHMAMEAIESAGQGVLLYMRQEGRGIGLPNKIRAYQFQDQGHDTVDANRCLGFQADLRDYGIGAQILRQLGLKEIRLMTNNPKKIIGLEGHGLQVVERVPIEIPANGVNAFYLQTKQKRLGHLFERPIAKA